MLVAIENNLSKWNFLNNKNAALFPSTQHPINLKILKIGYRYIVQQNEEISNLLCAFHETGDRLFYLVQNTVLSVLFLCENIINKIALNCWSQIEGGLTPSAFNYKKESYMIVCNRVLHGNCDISSVRCNSTFDQGGAL